MTTRTLLFSVYSNSGNVTPWQVGNSTPAYPTGYTNGGDGGKIFNGKYTKFSGSGNSVLLDDTVLTGNEIFVSAVLGNVGSDSQGLCLCTPAGTGYQFLINSTNIRCFAMTAFVLGAQVGSTISFVTTSGHEARLGRDNTTGVMTVYTGVAGGALTSRGTVTQANVNTDWRAGVFTRNAAEITSLTSEYTPAQTLDTITDPLVAGAAFSGTSTGFADGAAALSSNGISVAVTVASGAFSGTWPIAVDAQPYPTLPKSAQTITLTQGANTATIASDLEQPAGDDIVNFVSPVTTDDTYPTYFIEQDGFTADGGQFVFTPYSDLVIAADGEVTVTGAGVLVGYFIPETGTGAGNAYYYTFNVIDGGAVVSGSRGLSVAGLSETGLSVAGLSVTGL